MTDNKPSKLLVSKSEAFEKIRDRINIGKELLKVSTSTKQDFGNLERETKKWTDYNKTLFSTLFDKSPLPDQHGSPIGYKIGQSLNIEVISHKEGIEGWINDLESVYGQLGLYEELPSNTQPAMDRDTTNNENKKIFIGHGGSHVWREFKDFIVETLELDYEEFNRISAVGKPTSERLKEMLEESSIAIIIMTGEDEQADGSLRARENVIHEIGLFQGKLGFEQTIILLEDGCKDFSNIHGITHIPFPKGEIEATFGRIFKTLKQKSMT